MSADLRVCADCGAASVPLRWVRLFTATDCWQEGEG